MKGTVKWFSGQKGYGFVTPSDGGKDVFCHFSSIVGQEGWRSLNEGDVVDFEIVQGERGAQTANVKLLVPSTPSQRKEQEAREANPAPESGPQAPSINKGFKRVQKRGKHGEEREEE